MKKTQCHLHLIIHLVKEDEKSSKLNTKNNHKLTLLKTNMKNPLYRGKYIEYWVGEYIWKQPSLERKFVSSVIAT